MADVVLLYDTDCPNVGDARANLLRAFSAANIPAAWREVDRSAANTPEAWKNLGSPAIVIDGHDIHEAPEGADGACCRIYDGIREPSVPSIVKALRRRAGRVSSALGAIPGIVLALLPKGLCPACWPASAGVLSAVGLGFLMQDDWLILFTVVFLVLATAAIAFRAKRRRGYAPAFAATGAGILLVIGKFVVDVSLVADAGIAFFVLAAVWNAWPIRNPSMWRTPNVEPNH